MQHIEGKMPNKPDTIKTMSHTMVDPMSKTDDNVLGSPALFDR